MREIKFRAWDKENKEMSDNFDLFDIYCGYDESNIPGKKHISMDWHEELTLMQYTGLKDKNGKEIYHKDRLYNSSDREPYYIMEWDDINGCWSLGENGENLDKYQLHKFWEVIGNEFEN